MNPPRFYAEGDRYTCLWPDQGVGISIENIKEHSEGLHGEITVNAINAGGEREGHIHWARLGLSSSSARQSFAKVLSTRVKGDAIDWLNLLEYACTKTAQTARSPAPVVDLAGVDLSAPEPYCVRPLLPLGETSVLFGDGGTGKSYLALLLSLAVAGRISLPSPLVAATHGPVLYCDYETNAMEQASRLSGLVAGLRLSARPSISYQAKFRALPDEISSIKADLQRLGATLLIVDSIAPACGGEPESAEVILRFMNALRSLGPSVTRLVISHVSKADADKHRARPFGSAFTRNMARSCWEIRSTSDPEEHVLTVGLYHDKTNRGAYHKPFALTFTWDPNGRITAGRTEVADHPDLAESAGLPFRIRQLLSHGPKTIAAIAADLDSRPGSVYKALRRMKDVVPMHGSKGRGRESVWSLKAAGRPDDA